MLASSLTILIRFEPREHSDAHVTSIWSLRLLCGSRYYRKLTQKWGTVGARDLAAPLTSFPFTLLAEIRARLAQLLHAILKNSTTVTLEKRSRSTFDVTTISRDLERHFHFDRIETPFDTPGARVMLAHARMMHAP